MTAMDHDDQLPALPALRNIDSWLHSIILKTPISNGLAILIGCSTSYKPGQERLDGVQEDLKNLQQTFSKLLLFTTVCLDDPSAELIKEVIRFASKIPETAIQLPKNIVVTFSGHGDEHNLMTKDGDINLRDDIVSPLQEAGVLAHIPKLFFIDACRGMKIDQGIDISWLKGFVHRGEGDRVPSGGNCFIAYSTLLGMQSFERPKKGGLWMQLLTNELTNPENVEKTIQDIMTDINQRLVSICNEHSSNKFQQPVHESTLLVHVKLLQEAKELLQGHPQQPEYQQQQRHLLQQLGGYQGRGPKNVARDSAEEETDHTSSKSPQQQDKEAASHSPISDEDFARVSEILKKYSPKWRQFGLGLGFKAHELDEIQSRPVLFTTAPSSFLEAMLSEWQQWAPGDVRGSNNLASLKKAVDKAGLGRIAHDL